MTDKPAESRGRSLATALVSHPYVVAASFLLAAAASAVTVWQFASGDDDPPATAPPAGVVQTSDVSETPDLAPTSGLVATIEPTDPQVTQYLLPMSVDLDEMPFNANFCLPEQIAWLEENGVERQRSWVLTIRNTAEGGTNMLAVTDVRFEAPVDTADPAEPVFVFGCPSAGAAEYVRGTLDLADGAVVINDETGGPLALNLAPGEVVQVEVYFDGTAGAQAPLVADVASGADILTQTLIAEGLTLPAVGSYAGLVVELGAEPGVFNCSSADFAELEECGADEIPAYAELWRG